MVWSMDWSSFFCIEISSCSCTISWKDFHLPIKLSNSGGYTEISSLEQVFHFGHYFVGQEFEKGSAGSS